MDKKEENISVWNKLAKNKDNNSCTWVNLTPSLDMRIYARQCRGHKTLDSDYDFGKEPYCSKCGKIINMEKKEEQI